VAVEASRGFKHLSQSHPVAPAGTSYSAVDRCYCLKVLIVDLSLSRVTSLICDGDGFETYGRYGHHVSTFDINDIFAFLLLL